MHAIIETGGKQYRVAPGDVIRVEKLAGDIGSVVELPVKAAFKEGGELVSGKVTGTIVGVAVQGYIDLIDMEGRTIDVKTAKKVETGLEAGSVPGTEFVGYREHEAECQDRNRQQKRGKQTIQGGAYNWDRENGKAQAN